MVIGCGEGINAVYETVAAYVATQTAQELKKRIPSRWKNYFRKSRKDWMVFVILAVKSIYKKSSLYLADFT